MSAPRVSIIMRTKDSDWVVGQALASLYSQEYKDFELVVIDSGSTDRTLELVAEYPCTLIEIKAQDYYPGPVLNQAIEAATGEIMVFQNSDSVFLTPTTLGRIVAAFDDQAVQAAFGRQLPRPEADDWVRRDYAVSFPDGATAPPWITLSLPLAAMRKSIWKQRPFYRDAWGSEDSEWGHWARRNGHVVRYVSDALTMHSHNYTLKQLYGRRFIEGEADAFIFRQRRSAAKLLPKIAGSIVKDAVFCVRNRHWKDLAQIAVRRAVYHWGYYRGAGLGERRLADNDTDASQGQREVLSRQ